MILSASDRRARRLTETVERAELAEVVLRRRQLEIERQPLAFTPEEQDLVETIVVPARERINA